MKKMGLLLVIWFCFATANAQVDHRDYSAWNMVLPKAQLSEKVSVQSEFHRRSTGFYTDLNQWVIRPQIDYKVSDVTTIGLGYSWFDNIKPSPQLNRNENNIYQNFKFKHKTKLAGLTHQIRVEERFIEQQRFENGVFVDDGTDFKVRFRYRFTAKAPIVEFSENSNLSLVVFDEVFLNMSNQFRPQSFNQNWILIAPSWKINDQLTLTSGYHDIYSKAGNNYNGNSVWNSVLAIKIK